MTPHKCLYLIAGVLVVIGWGTSIQAANDVTVVSPPAAATSASQKGVAPDGTPVVHIHKKKHPESATASGPGGPASPVGSASLATARAQSPSATATGQAPAARAPVVASASWAPTVETGPPVARYPGMGGPITGVSTYVPTTVTLPQAKSVTGTTTRQSYFASTLPSSAVPLATSAAGSYSSLSRTTSPPSDFVFANFTKKAKHTYPWRTNIVTTMFWIGEGATPISSTTNEASAWDLDWRSSNSGSDSPKDRNGYASARHAATVNPFYVALPFNDLAFPDKARDWLPRGWYRRPRDGKQVSACKDRWVEIKNAQGDVCYAQWEDVGPLRYDQAGYVFGNERPVGLGDNHAGLDVSPAVADYLNINDRNRLTSWRFVDDEDVRPGAWLKLDEQAVIYTALHQLKTFRSSPDLPIQRESEPIDDRPSRSERIRAD